MKKALLISITILLCFQLEAQNKKDTTFKWKIIGFGGLGLSGNMGQKIAPNTNDPLDGYNWPEVSIFGPSQKVEYPGFSYSFGLNINLIKIGRVFIKSGIEYQSLKYSGAVTQISWTNYDYRNNINAPVITTGTQSVNQPYNININFFQFPLGVIYSLNKSRDYLLGLDVGGSLGLVTSATQMTYDSNNSYFAPKSPFLYCGILYGGDARDNSALYIEPSFYCQALSSYGIKFYSILIKVGLVIM